MTDREELKILSCIGSTEPTTFPEFLWGYEDKPEKGDKQGWSELFGALEWLEHQGQIEIARGSGPGRRMIDTMILTEAGAARVRSAGRK